MQTRAKLCNLAELAAQAELSCDSAACRSSADDAELGRGAELGSDKFNRNLKCVWSHDCSTATGTYTKWISRNRHRDS